MTTAPPLHGDCAAPTCTIPTTADDVEAASSSPCLPQHEQPTTAATAEMCLVRMLEAEDSVVSHLRTTTSTTATRMHDKDSGAAHLTVWRERVAQWAYTVVDHVGADRSVVYNVLLLLDSYLDSITGKDVQVDAATYQLLAMSCLYLVLRLRDSRALTVEQLVSMSRNDTSNSNSIVVTPRRIARTMKSILITLSTSWRSLLAAPAPGEFVALYVQQLQQAQASAATANTGAACAHTKIDDLLSATRWSALLDDATYLAELSVCDTYLRHDRPSVVAYAALLNVLVCPEDESATSSTTSLRQDLQSLQVLTGRVPLPRSTANTVRAVVARLGYVISQTSVADDGAANRGSGTDEQVADIVPQEADAEGEAEVVPTTVTPTTTPNNTPTTSTTSGVKRRIVSYEDVSAVVDAALPGMKRVRGHTGDLAELLQRSSDLASFSSASDSEEDADATATTNTTKRARLVAAAAAT